MDNEMDIKVSKLDLLHPKFPKIFVLQAPEELIEEKIRLQVRLRRGVYRDTLVPMKSAGWFSGKKFHQAQVVATTKGKNSVEAAVIRFVCKEGHHELDNGGS